jgi:hypothetical protein
VYAPLAGINVTAGGAYTSPQWVFTGASASNVTTAGDSCTDWTSSSANNFPAVGIPYESGPQGFYATTGRCSMSAPVYCLEL